MNENEPIDVQNSCKDMLAQMGPIEKLLGSVSYSDTDSIEGKTQQLRTSARVFKKMKFDLSNSTASEKKEIKKEEIKTEDTTKHEIKKNVSPLWSSEEKTLFFEALNEYGKDFESIHLYISNRLKKKGVAEDAIKTKYQIRNFYYRTFHMCGDFKYPEPIPKNVQELYTLINYGEIRKKGGSAAKKSGQKLFELIYKGQTSMKIKGKAVKIKTPMCRALRRLNQLDEKYDDLKLPTRVLVDLKPKDMASFVKVQSMAQNPRIRMAVSLQKRLSSLINCINVRWKTVEASIYDKALIATNPTTKECVPDQQIIDNNLKLLMPPLRLTPPQNAHIELPSIDISEYFTGQSICLQAFENRRLVKAQKDEVKKEEIDFGYVNKTDKLPISNKLLQCEEMSISPPANNVNNTISVHTVVDDAVNTILSLKTQEDSPMNNDCDNKVVDNIDNNNMIETKPTVEDKKAFIHKIRQGWTVNNCDSITIGELYLMFGSDSKLLLEYSWDSVEIKKQPQDDDFELCVIAATKQEENNLSNSLQTLLSLAKLQTNKTSGKCTCGHICNAAKTNTTNNFKRPISTKLVKKSQANQENSIEENDLSTSVLLESKLHKISNDYHYPKNQMVQLITQLDIERLNSKSRNKGKPRCKQLVVERKLVPNKTEMKHEIVSMNIVAQENRHADKISAKDQCASTSKDENNRIIDEESPTKVFTGILSDTPSNSNMSTGISKILNESDNQWIHTDVTDYSLSSLLGHLDGSTKSNQSAAATSISHEDSQLSHDVDAQLRTLLIETSVDYTAQFADLAAKVVDKK